MCTYTSALRNPSIAGVTVVVSYCVNFGLLEEQLVVLTPISLLLLLCNSSLFWYSFLGILTAWVSLQPQLCLSNRTLPVPSPHAVAYELSEGS